MISIEEMISRLTERIEKTLQMNFKDFAGNAKTKEEKIVVIIGFLAMLELVRQGILYAVQEKSFEDIIIKRVVQIMKNSKIFEPSPSVVAYGRGPRSHKDRGPTRLLKFLIFTI